MVLLKLCLIVYFRRSRCRNSRLYSFRKFPILCNYKPLESGILYSSFGRVSPLWKDYFDSSSLKFGQNVCRRLLKISLFFPRWPLAHYILRTIRSSNLTIALQGNENTWKCWHTFRDWWSVVSTSLLSRLWGFCFKTARVAFIRWTPVKVWSNLKYNDNLVFVETVSFLKDSFLAFLLFAGDGVMGSTLKKESSLPWVELWRAFCSFFIPERILSSL